MKKRFLLLSVFCLMGIIGVFAANINAKKSNSVFKSVADESVIVTASDPNPGNESIDKLHDGSPTTKWYAQNAVVWAQFKYTEAKTWRKYDMVSGNDSPDRDPKNWTISGSNDGSTWDVLDSRNNESWSERNAANTYEFENDKAYTYYKLDVTLNNGSAAVQISELTFTSNSDSEAPTTPTGLTATNIKFASVVLRWNPSTDNEAIANYQIYTEGFLIGTTAGSDTLYKVEFLDPQTTYAYTVTATDLAGNVSGESNLYSVTTAVDPKLTVTVNGENLPNEGADKLNDDDTNSKWLVFEPVAWAIFHYEVAQTWDTYAVTSGNDAPERDPSVWTIQGSNDGETWTVLDTQADQAWAERNQTHNYSIEKAAAYNYYKWDITASFGNATLIQVSELTYSLKTAVSPVITNVSDIRVYPNPSKGIVTIESNQAKNANVTVYNAKGQLLVSKSINNKVERIDLSAFKGLVLVKVTGEGTVTTKSIVIN